MSLGALTTTFTPPPSCTASFSTDFKLEGGWDVMGPVSTANCFPSGYSFAPDAFYSPGICPAGYSAACATPAPGGGGGPSDQVTTVTCCPGGYTCNPSGPTLYGSAYVCNSRMVSFVGPQVLISGSPPQHVSTTSVTVVAGDEWIANAFGLQIRYRSADFADGKPTATSTTSESSSKSGISSSSTSGRTTEGTPGETGAGGGGGGGGLSTGAAAGIGVGATLGFLLIVGVAFFAFRAGTRGSKRVELAGAAVTPSSATVTHGPHELSGKNHPTELPVREISELEGTAARDYPGR